MEYYVKLTWPIVCFQLQKCTVSTRSLQRLLLKSFACVPLSVCQRSRQRWGEVHDPEWLCPAVSGTAHSDPPQPQNCAAHCRGRWHHKGRVRVFTRTHSHSSYHHLAIHHRYMSDSQLSERQCDNKISEWLFPRSSSSSSVLGNVCTYCSRVRWLCLNLSRL